MLSLLVPRFRNESTYSDCIKVIDRYKLIDRLPKSVAEYFEKGAAGHLPETPKTGDPVFSHVQNLIVGNNRESLLAAKERAISLGYNTIILSSQIEGEAREVAQVFAAIGKEISKANLPISPPACVIAGGETTVTIQGRGKGGRSQELAPGMCNCHRWLGRDFSAQCRNRWNRWSDRCSRCYRTWHYL